MYHFFIAISIVYEVQNNKIKYNVRKKKLKRGFFSLQITNIIKKNLNIKSLEHGLLVHTTILLKNRRFIVILS